MYVFFFQIYIRKRKREDHIYIKMSPIGPLIPSFSPTHPFFPSFARPGVWDPKYSVDAHLKAPFSYFGEDEPPGGEIKGEKGTVMYGGSVPFSLC